ncbi:hypothetical protein V2G26_006378 [Clonostachys chloroleuca]
MSTPLRPHPSPEADSSLSAGQKPWMPDRDQVIEIRGTSHRSATPDSSQRYRFRSSSPSSLCVELLTHSPNLRWSQHPASPRQLPRRMSSQSSIH